MKNILVVGTADNMGGAARVSWDIARFAKNRGYGVKYLVGFKASSESYVHELKKNKILKRIDRKSGKNISGLMSHFRAFLLANDIDFGASDEILNHPWYKDADIVHCHNLHGHFFKLETLSEIASEKPVVWTLHDAWAITAHCTHCFDCKVYNNGRHFTPGLKRYQAILWNNSSYLWNKKKEIYKNSADLTVVTPSEWLAGKVKNSILGDKPLKVINNGIDTAVFRPGVKSELRKELGLPAGKTIIAYVAQWGTLDPRKGGEYFLSAAREFENNSDLVFLCIGGIVGSKPEIKGNIVYVPYLTDRIALAKYYSASDFLLFVSLAENFPLVTLEAMSSGLPVVAFDVGGVKEQINHKINGYIVKYKDAPDLINGIKYMTGLKGQQVKDMGLKNRQKALKFYTLEKMADSYLRLYETLY